MKTDVKAEGKRKRLVSTRARRLAALSKGAWALFVMVEVAAAGLLFLICFYLSLSFLAGLIGAQFGLKEWRQLLGEWSASAAWLLLGFLAARLLSQLSLDLRGRFLKVRCPDCRTELAPNEEILVHAELFFCPTCGAKL